MAIGEETISIKYVLIGIQSYMYQSMVMDVEIFVSNNFTQRKFV